MARKIKKVATFFVLCGFAVGILKDVYLAEILKEEANEEKKEGV